MSSIEYNSLIYEIGDRLDRLSLGNKLIFLCRGKVAPRSEENMQDASSLIAELEDKKLLAPDNLDLLKELLKVVKEWALLKEVEKFESKRKEYDILLNQIIRALDELNDLERLVSICGRKIPSDRQGNIRDVRSLFEELENNHYLGINRLDILKEILAQTEKSDLLIAVKEFVERRTQEDEAERRKGIIFCYVMCSTAVTSIMFVISVIAPRFCVVKLQTVILSPILVSFSLAQAAAIVSVARDNLTGGKFNKPIINFR